MILKKYIIKQAQKGCCNPKTKWWSFVKNLSRNQHEMNHIHDQLVYWRHSAEGDIALHCFLLHYMIKIFRLAFSAIIFGFFPLTLLYPYKSNQYWMGKTGVTWEKQVNIFLSIFILKWEPYIWKATCLMPSG